ncbi:GAF domain-containing sensor histidine kinase [Chroococcidiopsis sp. TS-821]|uniref:sensor histidine kinase n=1 Tax=Chroococcidiopsis sp. TS-821 TaxID=1378066 RepID=UPI00143DE9CD|nr:GAF domain-containing sensor histidine kinase [Chroococcidiopsis sp. TS-821]
MQHQQESAHLGYQINQIILNACDDQTRLREIAQILGEAFQVDWCTIIVMTSPQHTSAQAVGHWCANRDITLPLQPLLLSLQQLTLAYAESQKFAFDNVQATPAQELTVQLPLEVGAILGVPLWYDGKISGVVSFLRAQPHCWSEEEIESALAVATSVAIAIAQITQNRLIASLQQQVETSAQYQTLINQITMASRSSLDLNQIFQLALSRTAQALKIERGFIITLKYTDLRFKVRQQQNKVPKATATVACEWQCSNSEVNNYIRTRQFSISESWLCQQALLNFPQPIVINNQEDLSQLNLAQETHPIFDFQAWPALAMLPLENQGMVLGFIVLQHSCPHPWQADELALLELVGTQVSTAIIQSQTLRQVQSLVDERTAQLQRSLEVQAKLYEKTRQQIDQLRQLNQLKDEFVSTMNHELRTPLTSMSLAIRMLRQPGISAERQAKYLDILEQQCSQEINLINDLLKLQELESHKALLNVESVNLTAQLQNIARSFEDKWTEKGLTFVVDMPKTPLVLQTDAESLNRILQELLTNAGKYSEPNSRIDIQVRHYNDQIVLQIKNRGSGISAEDVAHIFDKFRRGKGVTQQAIQGTGLGLALVKCLVQHINGAIAVSSTTSDGSSEVCFKLTLPLTFDQAQT